MAAGAKRRLKVLHLIGARRPGGAETFAVRLITAQARHPDLDVCVLAREGGWVAKQLKKAGVKVVEAPFGGWFDRLQGVFGRGTAAVAQKTADAFKPAVVQGWMNRGVAFMPRGAFARVGRLGGYYKLKNYFKKVEYLIGNTKDICDYCVREGWPADKVAHVTNFVPLPVSGWRDGRIALRKKLGFATRDVVLVMMGRLHRVKGVDVALAALAKLPEDIKLMLVGEGPEREALEKLARDLGVASRVRFIGWANEVSAYAAAADIWLAPSRHEPLGNTVLDGWVHKLPVVAANTGGLAMLVKDGVSGLLVPVDDEERLAEAVLRIRRGAALAAKLVKGGMARYGEEFSQSIVVKRYVAYYREIYGRAIAAGKGSKA